MSEDEDFHLEDLDSGTLALYSATELDRHGREEQIIERKTLPYFSTLLLNTASELRGQKPKEPPFKTLRQPHSFGREGILLMIQRAFGEPEYRKITDLCEARASDLRSLASDLRNYRKLSPDQIEKDIQTLLGIYRAIQYEQNRRSDIRFVA